VRAVIRARGAIRSTSRAQRDELDTANCRSKSWDESRVPTVRAMFSRVAIERRGELPVVAGQRITAHWGAPDPVAFADGTDE